MSITCPRRDNTSGSWRNLLIMKGYHDLGDKKLNDKNKEHNRFML